MNRRRFLAGASLSISALSAACLTDSGENSTESPLAHTISLNSVQSIPEKYGLAGSVTVESEGFGGEGFPRVRMSLTNTGNQTVHVFTGNRPVMGERHSRQSEGLSLLNPGRIDESAAVRSENGCLLLPSPHRIPQGILEMELTQDESESIEAGIYPDEEHFDGQCPTPGTYQFSASYQTDHEDTGGERRDIGTFEWGFTISVES